MMVAKLIANTVIMNLISFFQLKNNPTKSKLLTTSVVVLNILLVVTAVFEIGKILMQG